MDYQWDQVNTETKELNKELEESGFETMFPEIAEGRTYDDYFSDIALSTIRLQAEQLRKGSRE